MYSKPKLVSETRVLDGIYREYSPSDILKKYVRKYYFTEGFSSLANKKVKTINKCNAEMIIHYGETKLNYATEKPNKYIEKTAIVIGGHRLTNLRNYKISGDINMFSIEFNYIGILKLLSIYPAGVIDSVIDIKDIFGDVSGDLIANFVNANNDLQRIKIIENFFIDILSKYDNNFCKENLLFEVMGAILDAKKPIKSICEELNVSKRYIERSFKKKIGFSAKEYYKISRINKACALLCETYPKNNLAEIAEVCDYTDLSHFNKEFKQLTGFSPSKYVKRNNTILYMGRGYLIYNYDREAEGEKALCNKNEII